MQDATPVIASSLAYWSDWVAQLHQRPTPAFAHKHDLIVHAVKLGLQSEATRRTAVELALATVHAVLSGGYWPVWQPILEAARAVWPDLNPELRIRLLSRLGQCYRLNGQLQAATAIHHEAEPLVSQLPSDSSISREAAWEVAFQLAEDYRQQAEYARAKALAQNAWELVQDAEAQNAWRASIANSLGLIHWTMGELGEADQWFTVAADLWQVLSRSVELSRTLSNLGNVLQQQGKLDDALIVYKRALAQLDDTVAWVEKLKIQYNTAVLYLNRNQHELAENLLRDAYLTLTKQPGDNLILKAYLSHGVGDAILRQGRFAEAMPYLVQAVAAWEKTGDQLNLGNGYITLAKALHGQGQVEAACAHCQRGLAILETTRATPAGERLYQERRQDCQTLGCHDG
jgi:tetratricopeptide (TPR) repeat protein